IVDLARRSPSARLYSLVPRSSQWPSMRTRLSLDFSHAELASRIFASLGRMSYLSKSKNTSFSSATATNSFGDGRVPGVDVLDPAPEDPAPEGVGAAVVSDEPEVGAGAAVMLPGVVAAAPVGAGAAETCVVAGRLAQPVALTPRISRATIN